MDIDKEAIDAILHPQEREKSAMEWIKYIFRTGGGIVWIGAYLSLYLVPFDLLASKYTAVSMIAWGALGLLLIVGTLFHRLKWEPNRERVIEKYVSDQEKFLRNIERETEEIRERLNKEANDRVLKIRIKLDTVYQQAMLFRKWYKEKRSWDASYDEAWEDLVKMYRDELSTR